MNPRLRGVGCEVWAPAKLNLFLEVLGRRDDGLHEIETLMLPIAWYDSLACEPTTDGRISLTLAAAPGVLDPDDPLPTDERNLVVRAARLLQERAGVKQRGLRIELYKRIPPASGLAGGSSNAAATLLAANLLWELGWSRAQLSELAAELGSDVPFFLLSSAAIARGRGERLEPVAPLGKAHFVVARPGCGLSTAEVYRRCRPAAEPRSVRPLLEAWRAGRADLLAGCAHNALQSPAEALEPAVAQLREEFTRFDCLLHQMSGSGTSYFGLCRHGRHAARLAARLRARNLAMVRTATNC